MKKIGGKGLILTGVVFIIICLVLYTIWDNNRIVVVKQDIMINNLPEELEGFKILQVTDLHEREFGTNQSRLVNLINSISYDAIVFTGDMLDSTESTNYKSFYKLIEGLENKDHALYVPGNADPRSYILDRNIPYEKHEFDIGMEARGVKVLESIHSITRGASSLHFVNFDMSTLHIEENKKAIERMGEVSNGNYRNYLEHQYSLLEELQPLDTLGEKDILIALNHYPIVDGRIDILRNDPSPKTTFRDYDLMMAGHYHGGQIRFPFVGALFVPEPYYKWNGIFPPQDRVKGLWEYDGIQQYVSAGLGSSDAISFLQFRFLNPPEINVLTLTRRE
ncbi:putative MPP superfamily phosphohydrolase [Evansella vedderi]|uniref:MPP superfamily phosphohydrolase n=1 Tax=Evansella vedderi TaxID=38282 RepID=A0ABU0A057_9BACI|nr:metallophosphoesterase [Evansella vedderi]MDQ0256595.1 putative MPP superfamily phosphohydrolase [Evansella vedderi]